MSGNPKRPSSLRHDSSAGHVSGESEFVDDRPFTAGELHADVVYSPFAHARIRRPWGSKSGSRCSRAGRRRPMISISKLAPPGPSGGASSVGT